MALIIKNRLRPRFREMLAGRVTHQEIRKYIGERLEETWKTKKGIVKHDAHATINKELALPPPGL